MHTRTHIHTHTPHHGSRLGQSSSPLSEQAAFSQAFHNSHLSSTQLVLCGHLSLRAHPAANPAGDLDQCTHFTDENTASEGESDLPKVTQKVDHAARTGAQSAASWGAIRCHDHSPHPWALGVPLFDV